MSVPRVQTCDKYLSARTKCHLLLSVAGGILIPAFLVIAGFAANRAGYERLGNVLLIVVFWTWGIFGAFFDMLQRTQSGWLPNPIGLVASFLFSVVLFSLASYILLWVVREYRYAWRVEM